MSKQQISPTIIRQVFILLVVLLIGILIFREMLPYFSGVLGAITIYVLMRPWMATLVKKGWHPDWAASFLMLISFVGILLPITGVVIMLTNKIGDAVTNSEKVTAAVKTQIGKWEGKLGYDLSSQIDVQGISSWISENLQSFAGGTFTIFIAVGLMCFMLYYMLTNRRALKESLFEYIPINRVNLKTIGQEVNHMVRSNALGIPMVAIAQGIIALIGFLIFGIKDPFFWFVIVTIGSMIPFVGTLIGILPVFILTYSSGDSFGAWGILIYGLVNHTNWCNCRGAIIWIYWSHLWPATY
jgi:predicted PurR-regulated permease PerM